MAGCSPSWTPGSLGKPAVSFRLGRARLRRRPALPPPPIFEGETGAVFLRHFHPVLADLARDDSDVAEVEVDVIVGILSRDVAVREDRDVLREVLGNVVVPLDRLLSVSSSTLK